jgi:hypothetical protein
MPPNMLGRDAFIGATGAGRAGLTGVPGVTGDIGRAGGEYDREPRLPPLPARAHTSVATPADVSRVSSAITVIGRSFMRIVLPPTVMA